MRFCDCRDRHTATVNSPHFDVSSPRLFLLADHSSGITRSVATYMYVSVFQRVRAQLNRGMIQILSHLDCIIHLDHPWVSQGAQFPDRIPSER